MSNRTYYPSQSSGAGRVYMEFELRGAGAAPLTMSTDAANAVASISRSGVGVYVVTLKDAFNKCLYKGAEMDDSLNDGAYATVSDLTNEGTATPLTFTIRTRNAGGTATEAASGRRIGVALVLRNGTGWGMT
jgi:hypothetical protein